ncbi:MAG: alpha/beta hydrolase [Pseudomonadota bacterium]
MKIADADILIIPGYTNSSPEHWQSRWEKQMKTARRVQQDDWHKPVVEDWTANIRAAIEEATKPVVAVAHSLGVQAFVQAVQQMGEAETAAIAGAFLVAPPDVENPSIKPKHLMTFGPYPRKRLPFPSVLIHSTNDDFCAIEKAEEMGAAWGSLFVNARENGHLNAATGHGPWPDGLMVFANFMKEL